MMTIKFAPPIFNPETHVPELNVEFQKLANQLGANNRRGSQRYRFETDFAYAVDAIQGCPPYLQGKMFDLARLIVNQLSATLRARNEKHDDPKT